MPFSASSKRPNRRCVAPVKAPFSWPNNSDAMRSRGITAQFTLTNVWEDRGDRLWMARATSSFPVPVSPVIRTLESVGATLEMRESTFRRGAEIPTISSNIDALSSSSRKVTFSSWSRCSASLRSSISVPAAYRKRLVNRRCGWSGIRAIGGSLKLGWGKSPASSCGEAIRRAG